METSLQELPPAPVVLTGVADIVAVVVASTSLNVNTETPLVAELTKLPLGSITWLRSICCTPLVASAIALPCTPAIILPVTLLTAEDKALPVAVKVTFSIADTVTSFTDKSICSPVTVVSSLLDTEFTDEDKALPAAFRA